MGRESGPWKSSLKPRLWAGYPEGVEAKVGLGPGLEPRGGRDSLVESQEQEVRSGVSVCGSGFGYGWWLCACVLAK